MAKRGNPNMVKGAPSVNPTGRAGKQTREDGFVNDYTGHGTRDDRRIFTRHYTRAVRDHQAIDLCRGNWLAKRIVSLLPSACFRRGFTIKGPPKGQSEKLMARWEELKARKRFGKAGRTERMLGGAAIFPVAEGALGRFDEPVDWTRGGYRIRALHVLEPRELIASRWYESLLDARFRQPSHYRLCSISSGGVIRQSQVEIHESRLILFQGERLSEEYLDGQDPGWGDSVLTAVEEVLADYGLAWGSAATILHNYSEREQAIEGLSKILTHKGNAAILKASIRELDMLRSTLRTRVVDATARSSSNGASVSGQGDLLREFRQEVAAAADVPATRLFGMSPGGLNSTGEYDEGGWFERVEQEQLDTYQDPVEDFVKILMFERDSATGGREPDTWSVEWLPLKAMSAKETAEVRKLDAETDEIRIRSEVYSADDAAKSRYGGDTYGSDITIDWKAREQQKKADEAAAAEVQAAMAELDDDDGEDKGDEP